MDNLNQLQQFVCYQQGATYLFLKMIPLLPAIRDCNLRLQVKGLNSTAIRDLEDERFACQLELQCGIVLLRKILTEADDLSKDLSN
jgi:hypothetical protein